MIDKALFLVYNIIVVMSEDITGYMQTYRSGHNGADSKSTPVRATKKSPIPCVSSTHRVLLKFIFLLVLSCFSILFLTLFFSRI